MGKGVSQRRYLFPLAAGFLLLSSASAAQAGTGNGSANTSPKRSRFRFPNAELSRTVAKQLSSLSRKVPQAISDLLKRNFSLETKRVPGRRLPSIRRIPFSERDSLDLMFYDNDRQWVRLGCRTGAALCYTPLVVGLRYGDLATAVVSGLLGLAFIGGDVINTRNKNRAIAELESRRR